MHQSESGLRSFFRNCQSRRSHILKSKQRFYATRNRHIPFDMFISKIYWNLLCLFQTCFTSQLGWTNSFKQCSFIRIENNISIYATLLPVLIFKNWSNNTQISQNLLKLSITCREHFAYNWNAVASPVSTFLFLFF